MEPFLLAVWIFTGHHFTERCTTTVTVLRLFGIVEEVVLLRRVEFCSIHFLFLAFENLLLRFFFVFILELASQHGLVLQYLTVQLI